MSVLGAVLLALLLTQGEAVRIHALDHAEAAPAPTVHYGGGDTPATLSHSTPGNRHDASTCPLCQNDSAFGQYLASATPAPTPAPERVYLAAPEGAAPTPSPLVTLRRRIRGPPVHSV